MAGKVGHPNKKDRRASFWPGEEDIQDESPNCDTNVLATEKLNSKGPHKKARDVFGEDSLAWSKVLWKDAARRISRNVQVLAALYLGMAYLCAWYDGYGPIDAFYLMAASVTTIGLGDVSPQTQITRAASLFMLPFGLIIIGFVVSLVMAIAKSSVSLVYEEEDGDEESSAPQSLLDAAKKKSFVDPRMNRKSLMLMLTKYAIVIMGGAAYFKLHEQFDSDRPDFFDEASGQEMTWIDSVYFATVVATTVGYGHQIWPRRETTKIFCIFYFLIAATVVGGIIGDLANMAFTIIDEEMMNKMVDSCIWVHRADLLRNGRISQTEYVLFKLHQMQKLDENLLIRLTDRFKELDVHGDGTLDIGVDCPSAEQVKLMQLEIRGSQVTLPEAWRMRQKAIFKNLAERSQTRSSAVAAQMAHDGDQQPQAAKSEEASEVAALRNLETRLADQRQAADSTAKDALDDPRSNTAAAKTKAPTAAQRKRQQAAAATLGLYGNNGGDVEQGGAFAGGPVRFVDCYDFGWSRGLWREASRKLDRLALAAVVLYLLIGIYLLSYLEGDDFATGLYLMAATVTTVGYGDVAPTTQLTRAFAVAVIPCGLIVLGFLFSLTQAHRMARPFVVKTTGAESARTKEMRLIFEELDTDGDGGLSRSELVAGARHLGMTPEEAGEFFDALARGSERLERPSERKTKWRDTVAGRCLKLVANFYGCVLVGALLLKFGPERNQGHTWIDALYFSVVTCTGIGYGDIYPVTDMGRSTMTVFILLGTIVAGSALSDMVDVYTNDVIGEEIVEKIIVSTTWVHKADLDGDGKIGEADYILFKLQQMQKVDAAMLKTLMERFEEIDIMEDGSLDVGVDVPSAQQVKEMQAELERGRRGLTLMQLWRERQALGLNLTVQPKDNSDHKQAQKPSKAAAASGEQTKWAHLLDPLPRQLDEIAKWKPKPIVVQVGHMGLAERNLLGPRRITLPQFAAAQFHNPRMVGGLRCLLVSWDGKYALAAKENQAKYHPAQRCSAHALSDDTVVEALDELDRLSGEEEAARWQQIQLWALGPLEMPPKPAVVVRVPPVSSEHSALVAHAMDLRLFMLAKFHNPKALEAFDVMFVSSQMASAETAKENQGRYHPVQGCTAHDLGHGAVADALLEMERVWGPEDQARLEELLGFATGRHPEADPAPLLTAAGSLAVARESHRPPNARTPKASQRQEPAPHGSPPGSAQNPHPAPSPSSAPGSPPAAAAAAAAGGSGFRHGSFTASEVEEQMIDAVLEVVADPEEVALSKLREEVAAFRKELEAQSRGLGAAAAAGAGFAGSGGACGGDPPSDLRSHEAGAKGWEEEPFGSPPQAEPQAQPHVLQARKAAKPKPKGLKAAAAKPWERAAAARKISGAAGVGRSAKRRIDGGGLAKQATVVVNMPGTARPWKPGMGSAL